MKNKFFIPLLLLFLAILGGWLYTLPVNSIEEGKNVFSSNYFKEYRAQLKNFVKQHPSYQQKPDLERLVKIIEEPLSSPDQARLSHQRFVTELRAQAALQVAQSDQNPFLSDLIRWIYTEADLRDATERYLYQYIPKPKNDLLKSIKQSVSALGDDPQFQGILLNDEDDPFLDGNLPSIQFNVNGTKVIRMGTPATLVAFYPRFWSKSTIHPDFLEFIKVQPSHLYVNLMKREGLESSRTKAIESLEKEFPNIYVVSLDKNSTFYTQNAEEYPEFIENQKFKEIFLNQLLKAGGTYFWSQHLDPKEWEMALSQIYDQISATYFADKQTLNQKERQDLIELSYVGILDRLVEKLKPASMNITCRQGIDRGPSLMVLWMISKGGFSNEQLEAFLLAPPILMHNRASYPSKIARFISAAERIYTQKKGKIVM